LKEIAKKKEKTNKEKMIINQITKRKRKANTFLKRNNCQFFFGKFSPV